MPLIMLRDDITKIKVDAIVNAANETLLGGGGVDGAIHRAAGSKLLSECMTLGGCKTGEAKITGGYNLPARYVIHTVGPIYKDGLHGERELLESAYCNSLALAKKYNCETVAFPLISAGAYGYPKDEAFKVATEAIKTFLLDNDMTVYLVIFDSDVRTVDDARYMEISEYIDDNYADLRASYSCDVMCSCEPPIPFCAEASYSSRRNSRFSDDLDRRLEDLDESFSEMLLRKIDEKGMTDAECYKRANIDRKLFSKIRSGVYYRPSKPTVLAFAIALELTLDETEEMLKKAGFALSKSNKFDVIVEYFISHGIYNVLEINETLFEFDQRLLGG